MKKLILGALIMLTASSCSMFRTSSATVLNVDSALESYTEADLSVTNNKISFKYTPSKQDRKAGQKHIINNATAAALKANGDADILVERQYEIVKKTRLFRGPKIKSVTITGYPGTYKNFTIKNSK